MSQTTSQPVGNCTGPAACPEQSRRADPKLGRVDKLGLECRYCGCRYFRVIYTRRGWGDRLLRRRECRHCGKRMTTWERPIGE
jgi:hypothetical protein